MPEIKNVSGLPPACGKNLMHTRCGSAPASRIEVMGRDCPAPHRHNQAAPCLIEAASASRGPAHRRPGFAHGREQARGIDAEVDHRHAERLHFAHQRARGGQNEIGW